MNKLILLIILIATLNANGQHQNPISTKDAPLLNNYTEHRFDNIGLVGTFGAYTQFGVRFYGQSLYASVSYCANRVSNNKTQHGAQILVAWYKDLGKNKKVRLSVFTQLALHERQQDSTRVIYGNNEIAATPIGLKLSLLLND